MLAAILRHPPTLDIADIPAPDAGAHEVVIDVTITGVCGTDLALVSGDYPTPLPLVPGHEFVGYVSAVGEGVSPALVGKRVTAEINNTCRATFREGLCEACRVGLDGHCIERTVTGIVSHDGAFAEKVVVPAAAVHTVPDVIADVEAVFIEPVAAALQTFEMAPLGDGDTVVVLGVGRLGYLVAGVARSLGAEVLAVSKSRATCERVAGMLDVPVVALDEVGENGVAALVMERTDGLGASHVVEATGTGDGAALALATRLVRPCGVIDLKSTPGDFHPGIALTDIVVNEVRLQGSRCGPFDKAIALMADHPFPIAQPTDEEFPLAEADRAVECARTASKVLIRCQR